MKAPVGFLSDRTVLRSKMEGPRPDKFTLTQLGFCCSLSKQFNIEANFYSQDLTPAAPQPRQNEKPAATKISGKEILEAIRLMDAEERRELTRALFA